MAVKKGRGRPKKPVDQLRQESLTITVLPATKARLKAAAAESGRSLSREVEARLEDSYAVYDDIYGDEYTHKVFMMAALGIRAVQHRTGKSWRDDYETKQQIKGALAVLIDAFGARHPDQQDSTIEAPGGLGVETMASLLNDFTKQHRG